VRFGVLLGLLRLGLGFGFRGEGSGEYGRRYPAFWLGRQDLRVAVSFDDRHRHGREGVLPRLVEAGPHEVEQPPVFVLELGQGRGFGAVDPREIAEGIPRPALDRQPPELPRVEDLRYGRGVDRVGLRGPDLRLPHLRGRQRGYEIDRQVYGLAVPHHARAVDARALEDDRGQFAGRLPQGFGGLFDDGETLPAVMDPLGFAEGDAERFEALDVA